ALVVSGEDIGPTGEDRTFWVIEAPGDEAKITDLLAQRGLAGTPLETAGGLKLFMLAGYVQPDDGRLIAPTGRLSGVIGAAPVFGTFDREDADDRHRQGRRADRTRPQDRDSRHRPLCGRQVEGGRGGRAHEAVLQRERPGRRVAGPRGL